MQRENRQSAPRPTTARLLSARQLEKLLVDAYLRGYWRTRVRRQDIWNVGQLLRFGLLSAWQAPHWRNYLTSRLTGRRVSQFHRVRNRTGIREQGFKVVKRSDP